MARKISHYENFVVVSFRQPRRIRDALASIYAYCRFADDLADSGNDPSQALAAIDHWEHDLDKALQGSPAHPILESLTGTISSFDLPVPPFRDLLTAFRQDQRIQRYQTFQELLNYCRCSADPVGRIVLALFGYRDEGLFAASDAICTGLQLANFWQDVDRDAANGRIYLPLEDMSAHNVTEEQIASRRFDDAFKGLIAFEVERTRSFFEEGKALVQAIGRNLRWEIEMFRRAGSAVMDGIERVDFDVLHHRPTISRLKKVSIAIASLPSLFGSARYGR